MEQETIYSEVEGEEAEGEGREDARYYGGAANAPLGADGVEEDTQAPQGAALGLQQSAQDAESGKKKKVKKKKPLPPIRVNLSNCKYEVLRIVQRKLGWREVGDDDEWEVYWTDTSVSIERIMKLSRIQKINHFCGMLEICRKRPMARNLSKMAKLHPQLYDFFPRTFILPSDREEFLADVRARGKKQIYILKPDAGCQGRGIRLVQGGKDDEAVVKVLSEMATPNMVAQHYLPSPLLINGYKFDLRIYVLVLSADPLRVFLFHEGLARICTEKYKPPKASNLDVAFMHLTNYAVNKKNEAFIAAASTATARGDEEGGEDASKWCLAQLREYLTAQGHDYDKVWADMADLIIKSLLSVQPILRNNYRSVLPPDNDGFSCFEILGYDIMLDEQLRPWLIEVNHSPSFNIDSPLDLAIKEQLISQALELVRIDPKLIAKTKKAEKKAAASRLLEPMHTKPKQQQGPGTAPHGGGGGAAAGGGGGGSSAAPSGCGSNSVSAAAAGAKASAANGGTAAAANGGGGAGKTAQAGAGGAGGEASASEDGGDAAAPAGSANSSTAPGAGSSSSLWAGAKPKTAEEYEAWRAEVLRARERYEAKHSGDFTRIFPSPDPAKQALYEELLKSAVEIYQSSFQARATRKPQDPAEEKKKKEDSETDSQKADRARQKALRDKLAQQAAERRKSKAAVAAAAQQQALPACLAMVLPHLIAGGPGAATGASGSPRGLLQPPPVAYAGSHSYSSGTPAGGAANGYAQQYAHPQLYGSAASCSGAEVYGEDDPATWYQPAPQQWQYSSGCGSTSNSRPGSARSQSYSHSYSAASETMPYYLPDGQLVQPHAGAQRERSASGGTAIARLIAASTVPRSSSPLGASGTPRPASGTRNGNGAAGTSPYSFLQHPQQHLASAAGGHAHGLQSNAHQTQQTTQQGAWPPDPFRGVQSALAGRPDSGGAGVRQGAGSPYYQQHSPEPPLELQRFGGVHDPGVVHRAPAGDDGYGLSQQLQLGGGSYSHGHAALWQQQQQQQLQPPHGGAATGAGGVAAGSAHNLLRHHISPAAATAMAAAAAAARYHHGPEPEGGRVGGAGRGHGSAAGPHAGAGPMCTAAPAVHSQPAGAHGVHAGGDQGAGRSAAGGLYVIAAGGVGRPSSATAGPASLLGKLQPGGGSSAGGGGPFWVEGRPAPFVEGAAQPSPQPTAPSPQPAAQPSATHLGSARPLAAGAAAAGPGSYSPWPAAPSPHAGLGGPGYPGLGSPGSGTGSASCAGPGASIAGPGSGPGPGPRKQPAPVAQISLNEFLGGPGGPGPGMGAGSTTQLAGSMGPHSYSYTGSGGGGGLAANGRASAPATAAAAAAAAWDQLVAAGGVLSQAALAAAAQDAGLLAFLQQQQRPRPMSAGGAAAAQSARAVSARRPASPLLYHTATDRTTPIAVASAASAPLVVRTFSSTGAAPGSPLSTGPQSWDGPAAGGGGGKAYRRTRSQISAVQIGLNGLGVRPAPSSSPGPYSSSPRAQQQQAPRPDPFAAHWTAEGGEADVGAAAEPAGHLPQHPQQQQQQQPQRLSARSSAKGCFTTTSGSIGSTIAAAAAAAAATQNSGTAGSSTIGAASRAQPPHYGGGNGAAMAQGLAAAVAAAAVAQAQAQGQRAVSGSSSSSSAATSGKGVGGSGSPAVSAPVLRMKTVSLTPPQAAPAPPVPVAVLATGYYNAGGPAAVAARGGSSTAAAHAAAGSDAAALAARAASGGAAMMTAELAEPLTLQYNMASAFNRKALTVTGRRVAL